MAAGARAPPPAPRKRAAHGDAGGAAGGKASSKLSTRPDDRAHGPSGAAGPLSKKQRRKPRLAPSDAYVRNRFGAGASALTDHDGAVLLMVLAGLYDH